MTAAMDEVSVRSAALLWLQQVTLGGTVPVTREQLANDFHVAGERFPLVDRGRGIRKPAGWRAALSIMTAQGRPYADEEGPDGLHRYKLRRDQGGTAENEALRVAMRDRVPLIWFYGLESGVFQAIFPVHLVGEEPTLDQFVLALTLALALCKIHHAAYDQNILAIRPDCIIEIHHRLLDELDGPMLRHGLQEHHARPLMQLPKRRADQPDRDRLEERYAQFRAA